MNLLTAVSMIVLGVTDMSRSVAFYRDVLGLQIQSESREFTMISAGSISLVLSAPLGGAKPQSAAMEIVFPVASVTAARAELVKRGVKFVNEPREASPGSFATTLTDPDGHHLTLFGPM